ncbi:MAG: hypothetical protein WC523_00725 [Patescibacteria group bacterium]
MSQSGNEMMRNLAKLLDVDMVKTAAKKEDKEEKKEEKKDEKDEDKDEKKEEKKEDKEEEKEEKKDEKKDKKKKKSAVMFGIINDLVKLANELDDAGATDASNLIDDALQVLNQNLDK